MIAFVTGATGLLGNNLVRALVAEGWEVRALVRSAAKGDAQLAGLYGVTQVLGDLDDVPALAPHLAGVDVIFHTASFFPGSEGPPDPEAALRRLNVDATVALARLGLAHGVRRFVHTSSSGTVGARSDGKPSTETDLVDPTRLADRYVASKVAADAALSALHLETGLDWVSVVPGWMFGPGDAAPTVAGQLVVDALAGRWPLVALPGQVDVVDARDVATAMLLAATLARPGERFIVAGRESTVTKLFTQLAAFGAGRTPLLTLPYPLAWIYVAIAERVAASRGKAPIVTRAQLAAMNTRQELSSQHAESRLGTAFRTLEVTLGDTVAWTRAAAA